MAVPRKSIHEGARGKVIALGRGAEHDGPGRPHLEEVKRTTPECVVEVERARDAGHERGVKLLESHRLEKTILQLRISLASWEL